MKSKIVNRKKIDFSSVQSALLLAVMVIIMSVSVNNFLTSRNLLNLVKQLSINLILAASFTHLKICNEVDISFGATMGFSSMALALILKSTGSIPLAFCAALAIGALVGLFNGLICVKFKLPAFIATYGTQMMLTGLTLVISQGQVVAGFPDAFRWFGQGTVLGIPVLLLFVIVAYVFWYIWLHKTKYGLQAYAVGNNHIAASLSGTNVAFVRMRAYFMHSLTAGFCGFLMLSRLMASQSDIGSGTDFEVISGCIVGGISFAGGEGHVFMAIIGVFIVGLIRNFLNLTHVNIFWTNFVTGAIIVLAMLFDTYRKMLQRKADEQRFLKK